MDCDSPRQTGLHSESEEENEVLFPHIYTQQIKESLQLLRQQFNKQSHSRELANYCFRCHDPHIAEAYLAFQLEFCPELPQPPVSSFFTNESFLSPLEVGRALKGEGQYPGCHIPPAPKGLKPLLDEVFEQHGCLPNLERLLMFYPAYLEKHLVLRKTLFSGDKIDRRIAYFLAICASAETGSIYMLARYLRQFKMAGGDPKWVSQGKYPPKYRLLLPLNRMLARAPWQISEDQISDILLNSGCHWSKNQLALCVEIMAFAHQNCTISLAMGLLPENTPPSYPLNLEAIAECIGKYHARVTAQTESRESLAVVIPHLQEGDELERKRALKRSICKGEGEDEVEPYMTEIGQELSRQDLYSEIVSKLGGLLPAHRVIEKRREHIYRTVDYSDFNFPFNAYPALNGLTQETADRIRSLLSLSEDMTRETFGQKSSNTKEFRKAMRYYSQNLCGYRHHEYDFKENVNTLLTIATKFYIRLLTLSPLHITPQVIREINHFHGQVECFDIGHMAILIANTKMSLALTLAMRAFEID